MTNNDTVKSLFKRDYCLPVLGLCGVAFAVLILTRCGVLPNNVATRLVGTFYGVFLPSVWDSLGFRLTQDRDADISENRTIYRIIQAVSCWGGFYTVIGLTIGWYVALGSALSWWLCSQDYLFYKLRKEPKQEGITWVSWSILGVIFRIKVVSWSTFRLSAFCGFAVAIISALL